MSEFTYEVECAEVHGDSGTRYGVYIAPLQRLVYTHRGEDKPASVAFGQHMHLGWVPACAVGDSLEFWLTQHETELARICKGYSQRGTFAKPRGDWTREAMKEVDRLGRKLAQAVRDQKIGIYWSAREWWATRSRQDLVQEALWSYSLESFADSEIEAAKTTNVWLNYDESLEYLQELLERRYQRLESMLIESDTPSWSHASFEHHRLASILGYVHIPDMDWSVDERERCQLQRSITHKIRQVPHETVIEARKILRQGDVTLGALDSHTLAAALAAAAMDDQIWDALSQIRQVAELQKDQN